MQSLQDAWPRIEERVARTRRVVVGTDFDGTLVPLQDRPEDVSLPPSERSILRRLAAAPGVTVVVITGRSLSDVDGRLDLPRAIVIGNHGFEMRLPGGAVRLACGGADLDALRAAGRRLAEAACGIPGVRLEDKGLTLALHYRQASPRDLPVLFRAVRTVSAGLPSSVRVTGGRGVFDIRPAVDGVDKGGAFRRVLAESGVPPDAMRWFFGDDATDEDVFNALPDDAVTVHVGPLTDPSAARYAVPTPSGVFDALGRMVRLREAGGRGSA